jgi:malate dehydrogenase (oxaloacetate-decarboxylating)
LGKNVYLANLRDCKEVLFYRLLTEDLEEMLPIVYTPTIGQAIERSVTSSAAPRGGPVDGPPDDVEVAFRNYGMGAEDVDLIVATDAEGILGIGDWDVGGIEIPSLLTVAGSS